jgi:diguanylate cyclase (GGDEF)-like protein
MIQTSQTDELTGLLTRKAFRAAFSAALSAARLQNAEQPLALGFIDIDNFLGINQEYGHVGGDEVLATVAQTLRRVTSEADLPSRYGGDEFAVLLLGKEREQAFLTLERLRYAISQEQVTTSRGDVVRGLSISIGVAAFPVDGRTEAELLRKADQALYRAKLSGRDQVRLAYEEKMVPKTAHFTQTQLERLSHLAEAHTASEADLLREAVDDLLTKYGVNDIES